MAEITNERRAALLDGLKVDLGIRTSSAYDDRLNQYIDAAVLEIERQGATLEETAESDMIIVSYAAWRWRTRDTQAGMPRALRFSINNLIFSQKAR